MAQRLIIVGPGVVGTTLGLLAQQAGYDVSLVARHLDKARQAAKHFSSTPSLQSLDDGLIDGLVDADILLLTVPDDQIATVAELLAEKVSAQTTVAHCSGALSSELLQPFAQQGCAVASIHPLQTFPNVAAALPRIADTVCYCEWQPESEAKLRPLVSALGMQVVEIQAQHKALYHASAVMACNYLSALIEAAMVTGEAADIDRDTLWRSLKPLIDATLSNIDAAGPANALTGPIVRGDQQTVVRHLDALQGLQPELAVYKALGQQAVELAGERLSGDGRRGLLDKLTES